MPHSACPSLMQQCTGKMHKGKKKKNLCVLKGWREKKKFNQPNIPCKKRQQTKANKKRQQIPQTCIEISITDCMINMPRKTYNGNSCCYIQYVSSAL